MHYYQHHIGDFIKATSCLSNDQMVSYLRLLWMYYDSENPLEDDPEVLALRVGAKVDDVRLILRAFFRLEGGVWRQSRCDREIAEYHAICERNSRNGKQGGRPKKKPSGFPVDSQSVPVGMPEGTEPEPGRNPDETLTSNHKPVTNIPPISPKGDSSDLPAWLDTEAWSGFVEMRKRIKKPMTTRARNLILAALDRMRAKGIDITEVLDNSTRNNWQDVYEPKNRADQGSEPKYGTDEYYEFHRKQTWWADAGFGSVYEATSNRCHHKNFHEFRNGQRIKEAA